MPYRDFELPNGRVVRTRVSKEATLEWYHEREESLARGYPDRPPDVDTDTLRQWIATDDEMSEEEVHSQVSSWPIAMYVLDLGAGHPTVKLLLSWMDPGDLYYLRMKAQSGIDLGNDFFVGEKYYSAEQTDQLNSMIEASLETMYQMEWLARTRTSAEPQWLITTPGDIVRTEAELDLAREEHEAEFGNRKSGKSKAKSKADEHDTGRVRENNQRRPRGKGIS